MPGTEHELCCNGNTPRRISLLQLILCVEFPRKVLPSPNALSFDRDIQKWSECP